MTAYPQKITQTYEGKARGAGRRRRRAAPDHRREAIDRIELRLAADQRKSGTVTDLNCKPGRREAGRACHLAHGKSPLASLRQCFPRQSYFGNFEVRGLLDEPQLGVLLVVALPILSQCSVNESRLHAVHRADLDLERIYAT